MKRLKSKHQADITNYSWTVNCFEVSSTGYINTRNKSTLATLHSLLRKDMKESSFFSELLACYGCYYSAATSCGSPGRTRSLPTLPSSSPHVDGLPGHNCLSAAAAPALPRFSCLLFGLGSRHPRCGTLPSLSFVLI